jgi:hypothetical protein
MDELDNTQAKLMVRIMVPMLSRAIPPDLYLSAPTFTFKTKLNLHIRHFRPLITRRGHMIDKMYVIRQRLKSDHTVYNHGTTTSSQDMIVTWITT